MLFSPVYSEAHPRRIVVHAASRTSSIFSNPFRSYSFRTLASHFQTGVSSDLFEIKRFRTLCKIPGIGYPFTQSGLCEGFTQLAPSFEGSVLREGLPLFFSTASQFDLRYFLSSIPFLFNCLQNAPPVTLLF
jgi:hypothetical protein